MELLDSSFTGFNAYWDKINTQAAGGALPDIIQMDMRYIGQFTQRSQLRASPSTPTPS